MIYLFLANGFEEIEALATLDVLRRAELDVKTVGVGSKTITGSHHIHVETDMEQNEVLTGTMDMVILPGGMPGTLNLENSPVVTASVRYCFDNGLPVAAICAAPSVLGHMGLLKGKKAVCFPGFEQELEGAELAEGFVCRDGNLITAKGAGAAIEFALEIVRMLRGDDTAARLRMSMQCP
ncbi:MAG TPA: DJ-1/PfpI family protein [Candidatus Gallacutalibacter pullistercoris]|nr:DJ-1/PfpI family protein [Candidatus Gallacutalibacter pullistercoris]